MAALAAHPCEYGLPVFETYGIGRCAQGLLCSVVFPGLND